MTSKELFVAYSRDDEESLVALKKHLAPLRRQGLVTVWFDREITEGANWEDEIEAHLESAHLIICLVSASFVDSDYCWNKELARGLERRDRREADLLPVIVKPVDWKQTPLGKIQASPKDGKAVSEWANEDSAWTDVAKRVRRLLESKSRETKAHSNSTLDLGLVEEAEIHRQLPEQSSRSRQSPTVTTAGVGNSPETSARGLSPSVKDWGVYEMRAKRYRPHDPGGARREYEKGLEALPNSAPLHGNFANLLRSLGELDAAEWHFKAALASEPDLASVLHDYAIFLWRDRNDPDAAAPYIDRAIPKLQDDAVRISNYGNFIWEYRKNLDEAEKLYKRAIETPCGTPEPFRNYALFLQIERREYQLADSNYHEALQRDPGDPATLVNYARLALILGDVEISLNCLERALASAPNDLNVLGAFAATLWEQRIDIPRSELLYRKALAMTPKNESERAYYAGTLISFARFLGSEHQELEEGLALIDQAVQLVPLTAGIVSARVDYLAFVANRTDEAERVLRQAMRSLREDASLWSTRATLSLVLRQDFATAEKDYRHALALDADLPNAQVNLGGILTASGRFEEGAAFCNEALSLVGRSSPAVALESLFYLYLHGPLQDRLLNLRLLKWLLLDGLRSPNWDLSRNVQRAEADAHPEATWLPSLASVVNGDLELSALDGWQTWVKAVPPRISEQ